MQQAIFVDPGEVIDFTPTAARTAGDVVVQGELVGVARGPLAAQVPGTLTVRGQFDVVKGATTFAVGLPVHWDPTGLPLGGTAANGAAATTAVGVFMGFCVRAAGVNDKMVRVALNASGPVGPQGPPGPEGPSWIPAPPGSGVWVLKAINGVVQWVEESWSSSA